MLKLTISILLTCLSTFSFSQTDGYKTLKIGEKLDLTNLVKTDTIIQIADYGFRLTSKTAQKFCEIDISYIDVKISEDTTINMIQVFTNEKIYVDNVEFMKDFQAVVNCMVNTVGKASYYDAGIDKKDGLITVAWRFDKSNKLLVLYANSLSIYEHNGSRHFLIAWAQGSSKTKMW